MTIKVSIEINREFDVSAGFDRAFGVLSNVPVSVSHFPKVDQLVDLGNNTFRWEMNKIGVHDYSLQTIYAAKYLSDKSNGSIVWKKVPGVGNAEVEGSWKVTETGSGCHVVLVTTGVMTLPLPSLLKLAVSPIVKHEFNALVDKYINNLQAALV
ncbi:MAG: hypothetical protein CSA52_01615 [Gammaproteobacteria bacterium]|nr:MAG: hypothetical protein CSB48_09505 [Pseudomonadota bacterium]PIE38668.1 MAG: hypothetical protein CSA52_01615 [Gammaproteobacteria bacterium]